MALRKVRKVLGSIYPEDIKKPPTEQPIWEDIQPMIQSMLKDHEEHPDHEYSIWVEMKGKKKPVKIQDVKL